MGVQRYISVLLNASADKKYFYFFIRLPEKKWQKTQPNKHFTPPAKFIRTIVFFMLALLPMIDG